MGDRAVVVFRDESNVSPTVYLHWNGSDVPRLLSELKETMKGREGDLSYSCARFVGICHNAIPGNLSLGLWPTPGDIARTVLSKEPIGLLMAEYSHGDAGFIVVDVRNFTWKTYAGYLESNEEIAA
jgi:hypothetical protein